MKKTGKILFILLFIVCISTIFTACNDDNNNNNNTHEHIYSEWEIKENPTCTKVGIKVKSCTICKKEESIEINALGHDIVEHESKEATCTEIGWNEYETCTRCDYTTYEEIAFGHDIVKHNAKAATCTEIGWNEYETCTRCDYTTYEEIKILEHNIVDGICSACGYVDKGAVNNNFEYHLLEDDTYEISKYIGNEEVITIPLYCNNLPVTRVGDRAFYNCSILKSVSIGNGVTSIGSYAFEYCSSLTSITIPDRETSSWGIITKLNQYQINTSAMTASSF